MPGTGKLPENYQIEDFVTDESFVNYFFRLDPEDEAYWEKWLQSHPDYSGLVETAKDMLRNLSLTLSDREYEEEIARIRKAIHYEKPLFARKRPAIIRLLPSENTSGLFKYKKKTSIKFIVPVLLVFIAGVAFYLQHFIGRPGRTIEKYNSSSKPIVFTIPDGTVVTLAPQGIFRYSSNFGNKDRTVYLDGEAQFNVTRDEAYPFKVYEGDIIATVLGTVFTIKKQGGDSVVLVELIKGRLKVETIHKDGLESQSILLNPDERVVYTRHGQKLYKEKWQTYDLPAQHNHLVFRQNNFEEVAKQIKAVFGIIVLNQSNKKNWRFTGKFDNTTAKEIIENICLVEGLTSQVTGDTILIK